MRHSLLLSLLYTKYDKLGKSTKVCSNCVHFTQNYNHIHLYYTSEHACKRYCQQDILHGKVIYEELASCRGSTDKCTLEGKDFEPAKLAYLRNLRLKVFAHFWKYRPLYSYTLLFCGFPLAYLWVLGDLVFKA